MPIFRKTHYYILPLAKVRSKDFQLVGEKALSNSSIYNIGIRVPESFVITTQSFDDYIVANNLASSIGNALSTVEPFMLQSAKDASEKITAMFLGHDFPNFIKDQILEAYHSLSRVQGNVIVNIIPSHVIDGKFLPIEKEPSYSVDIRGEKDFLYNLKLAWISLFSTKAIELRANTYYDGELTMAVLVKKVIRSEISGKIYSLPTLQKDIDGFEIKAMYGLINSVMQLETLADSYIVEKENGVIREKIVIPQEKMSIRPGNSLDKKEPNIEVDISKDWQKHPKLDDSRIQEIFKASKKLENIFKGSIEVDFAYEVGRLYITNVVVTGKKLKKPPIKPVKKVKLEKQSKQQKPDLEKIEKEIKSIVEEPKKVIEPLVEENTVPLSLENKKRKLVTEISIPKVKSMADRQRSLCAWMASYKLKTNFGLDISSLDSALLSNAKFFQSTFLDGTELILANKELPESLINQKSKLTKLVETFTVDITTAARSTIDKPFIYQFSNLDESDFKMLHVLRDSKSFYGDERFINNPQSLVIEAIAVKKAINNFGANNVSLSLPFLRNFQNLLDIKKILTLQKLVRSANLKIYAEYALPSLGFELEKIDNTIVDGIIINYDELARFLTYKKELREADHKIALKVIAENSRLIKKNKVKLIFRMTKYSSMILNFLINLDPDLITFTEIPPEEDIKEISLQSLS
jgi:phosphoenolpyruvate synthase/pyruvate phosphate dikinase